MSAAEVLDPAPSEPARPSPALRLIEGGARPRKGIPASWSRSAKRSEKELMAGPGAARTRIARTGLSAATVAAMRAAKARALPVSWITIHRAAPEPANASVIRWSRHYPETAGARPCDARSCSNHGATPCRVPACIEADQRRRDEAHERRRLAIGSTARTVGTAAAMPWGAAVDSPWREGSSSSRSLRGEDVSKPRVVRPFLDQTRVHIALDYIYERVRVLGARLDDPHELVSAAWLQLVWPSIDVAASEAALWSKGDVESIRRLVDKAIERGYRHLRPDRQKK